LYAEKNNAAPACLSACPARRRPAVRPGRFVNEAYELIENLDEFKDRVEYAGFVDIELRNSVEGMYARAF
jgi:hypothetical protein